MKNAPAGNLDELVENVQSLHLGLSWRSVPFTAQRRKGKEAEQRGTHLVNGKQILAPFEGAIPASMFRVGPFWIEGTVVPVRGGVSVLRGLQCVGGRIGHGQASLPQMACKRLCLLRHC